MESSGGRNQEVKKEWQPKKNRYAGEKKARSSSGRDRMTGWN